MEHAKSGFRVRLRAAWRDDRPLKQRLWLCLLPSFCLCYTVLFFGPVELYMGNTNAVRFSLADLSLGMGVTCIVAFACMAGVLLLLRGMVLNIAAGLAFGGAVAVYLQGNMLNLDLGVLDGTAIPWEDYTTWGLLNALIWLVLLALPLVLLAWKRAFFPKVVCYGSALIIAVQTVALVWLLPQAPDISRDYYHIDSEQIFEVSGKDNTIVFILDRFSNNLLEQVLAEDPGLKEPLRDFTWFNNYSADFLSTYPAVTSMLTGHRYDGSEGAQAFLDNAWASDSADAFYGTLRDAGFTNKLYINERYNLGSGEAISRQVDNIGMDTLGMDYVGMAKTMTKFSLYRYVPHALKARFWMETEDLGGARGGIYYTNFFNENFIEDLQRQGLRTQDAQNAFIVYHIRGPHSPYVMDAQMNVPGGETSEAQQAMGALRIVATYLGMLQEMNLYDDANIIITTDHGERHNLAAIFMAKQSGEQHTALETSSAPVCAEDLLPTILYMNGLPYEALGQPVYAFEEGQARERLFTPLGESDALPSVGGRHNCLHVYDVPADARDLDIRDAHTEKPLEVDSFY